MKNLIVVAALSLSVNAFAEIQYSNFPMVKVGDSMKSGVTKNDLQSKIESCQRDLEHAVSKLAAAGYSVLQKQDCTGHFFNGDSGTPDSISTSGSAQFIMILRNPVQGF